MIRLRFSTPLRSRKPLFITHQAPYRQASLSTISRWIIEPHRQAPLSTLSRWIVETISFNPSSLTGPGTPQAHDVRGVAASWALFQGAPLDDILQSAVWKNPNSLSLVILPMSYGTRAVFGRAALASVFCYYSLTVVYIRSTGTASRPYPSVLFTVGHRAINRSVDKVRCPRGKLVILSRVSILPRRALTLSTSHPVPPLCW